MTIRREVIALERSGLCPKCSGPSKILRPEFIEPSSLPFVSGLGYGVDLCPVGVENAKHVRFVARRIRLQSPERLFGHEERPFHRAVMAPEPHRASGGIKNAA